MSFPISETTETHKTEKGESKTIEVKNRLEFSFEQVLEGVATILAYKNEVERAISQYNAKHGIPIMVQNIKHSKNMVQSLGVLLNKLGNADAESIRYSDGVEITTTSKGTVEPKVLRKKIQEFNREAKRLQSEIDKLDAKEIEVDISEDRIDEIKEMFDAVASKRNLF